MWLHCGLTCIPKLRPPFLCLYCLASVVLCWTVRSPLPWSGFLPYAADWAQDLLYAEHMLVSILLLWLACVSYPRICLFHCSLNLGRCHDKMSDKSHLRTKVFLAHTSRGRGPSVDSMVAGAWDWLSYHVCYQEAERQLRCSACLLLFIQADASALGVMLPVFRVLPLQVDLSGNTLVVMSRRLSPWLSSILDWPNESSHLWWINFQI